MRPYPCVIFVPVIFFHLLAVSFNTAIPPPTVNLKLLKFISLNLEFVINKLNNVFTPVITVNLFFLIVLTKFFISLGFVINRFSEPSLKNVRKLTVSENM